MAEFAASIVAFIQLTDTVIRVCNLYISSVKDAPRDMVIISGEITSLRAILSCLNESNLHAKTIEALPTLFAPSGPIHACYQSITSLERLLPKVSHAEAKKTTFSFTDLAWALKEPQVRKLLAEITLHKSTLLLALTGDLMREVKDIKAGVERVENTLTRSERAEILDWLQFPCHDPSAIHNGIVENHDEQTSSWLYEWKKWSIWLQSDIPPQDRFLWIHGIPGAGKSVLASFIVESVKSHCHQTTDKRLGYAYYYCHYSHDEDSGVSFLRWVVSQLCRQAEWVPPQLRSLRDSGQEPAISGLFTVLHSVLEMFNAFYVVIDGVDESQPRTRLLSILATLATDERFQVIRLLATSRQHADIEQAFSGISASISMSNAFVARDIETVVHKWMTSNPRMQRWGHLSAWIETKLCSGARGMFRWVVCQMQTLERIREESQLILALNSLPKDLDEAYTQLFQSIPDQDRLFVRQVLLWIVGHASSGRLRDNGIHIDVLVAAVCDDLRHITGKTYRYTPEDVRELCGSLITVTERDLPFTDFLGELRFNLSPEGELIISKEKHDQPTPRGHFVKLAHYTVMEFLASDRIAASPVREFSLAASANIKSEFHRSVLRQSLTADPQGTSVNWIREREPYCLTLVPLIIHDADITDPEIMDMSNQWLGMQYLKSLGWTVDDVSERELVVSFLDRVGTGMGSVRTYRETVGMIELARSS
ncbi:hypothetical protein OQA88_5421 [Cercophora sp. LCS_1]